MDNGDFVCKGNEMIEGSTGTAGVDVRIEGFDGFEFIGQGGFGIVYRARQIESDRSVAVKVLALPGVDEQTRSRFEQEQQVVRDLAAHPGIAAPLQTGFTADGSPYLAMELMERGSAADRLRTDGPFSPDEAIAVMAAIADAVEAAHQADILHRDIKPENILFSPTGEAKLSDFGVAGLFEGTVTATTALAAIVDHSAPEVLAGVRATRAGDIYSLGSTLFALVAGHSPFRQPGDESFLPVLARGAAQPVPDLRESGVPDALCSVIEAAVAKNPAERIAGAGEMAEMLREAANAPAAALSDESQPVSEGAEGVVVSDESEPVSEVAAVVGAVVGAVVDQPDQISEEAGDESEQVSEDAGVGSEPSDELVPEDIEADVAVEEPESVSDEAEDVVSGDESEQVSEDAGVEFEPSDELVPEDIEAVVAVEEPESVSDEAEVVVFSEEPAPVSESVEGDVAADDPEQVSREVGVDSEPSEEPVSEDAGVDAAAEEEGVVDWVVGERRLVSEEAGDEQYQVFEAETVVEPEPSVEPQSVSEGAVVDLPSEESESVTKGALLDAPPDESERTVPTREQPRLLRLVGTNKTLIQGMVADIAAKSGTEVLVTATGELGRGGATALSDSVGEALASGSLDRVEVDDVTRGDRRRIKSRLAKRFDVEEVDGRLVITRSQDLAPPLEAPPPFKSISITATERCDECGAEMLADSVTCPDCGVAPSRVLSPVLPLLGLAAILVGALLPFARATGMGRSDAFSTYVSHALTGNADLGMVLGSVMVGCALIAGVLVMLRTRVVWPIVFAVLGAAPALWFIGDWLAENVGESRFDLVLRSMGTGPWMALFGLALVAVGARRPKTLLVVSAVAVVGGAFYFGFDYPVSLLWDQVSTPVWYAAASFLVLVLFVPGLILALSGKSGWVALSLIGVAGIAAIAATVELILDRAAFVGYANAFEGVDVTVPIIAGALVATAVVAQQARRRSGATSDEPETEAQ